ncbi:TonB-dependent receptor plug domain-containing protein [Pseudoalteromonas fenneropenaei]|uniref:TonB-dependent receptor plug domain-containing protein n=1 Tax=Pseudoalteromonas fenneropenaei TaxID=1737459 RepID=A0ABV7CFR1_9GAMM
MKQSRLSYAIRASMLAGVITGGLSNSVMAADEQAGAQEGNVERIEVTGSRIKRSAMLGASPVATITAEDIKVAGITRVEDLLNDMPAVFAGQTAGTANGATGTATADLRNLGPERTLVLINGRRMPSGSPSAGGISADLNQIPAALVKRVDVLTGGSSATYGSDAVAGVVNFILRDDFEGFEFEYQTSAYQHNNDHADMQRAVTDRNFALPDSNVWDGKADDFTVVLGANTADGRGNITAYATLRHVDALIQSERDFSACAMNVDKTGKRVCAGSGTIPEGRITDFDTYDFKVQGNEFVPTAGTVYNYGPLNYFQRPDTRKTFGVTGHYDIRDNIRVYAEASYMDDITVAQIAPSGSFFEQVDLHCDNPLFSAQQRKVLCTDRGLADDAVIEGAFIGKRNVEGGPRQDDLRHTSSRFVLGVKGDINDSWSYDAFMNFGSVGYVQTYQNDLSNTRIGRALNATRDANGNIVCKSVVDGSDPTCVPWNIFEPSKIDQEQLNYLIVPLYARGDTKTTQISGYLTGDLTDAGVIVPGTSTGVGVVFGYEYRKEYLSLLPDQNFTSGDGAGQGGPRLGVTGEFDVNEFFTEFNVPLLEDTSLLQYVNLELAYRYSDYSTDKQTHTYKAAFDVRVNDELGLRASYQRAVRAGNIRELFRTAGIELFNWEDPCGAGAPEAARLTLEQCQRTGLKESQYLSNALSSPAGQYNEVRGGNAALDPEKSNTYSFGILLSPEFIDGLDIAIDYFNITVEDAIQAIPSGVIHNQCAVGGNDEACKQISRDPATGALWLGQNAITSYDVNIGEIETSGIDFDVSYRNDIGDYGSMRYSVVGTWLNKFATQNLPGGDIDDCVGYWDRTTCEAPTPEYRVNFSATWVTPWDANITAKVRYFGEADEYTRDANNNVVAGDTTLGAVTYLDIAGTWQAHENVTFRAGINNLLDRQAPIVPNGPSGISNGNTFPGPYDALGRYLFAGVTLSF